MKLFITGTAGFIGFHLVKKLSESGWDVVGLDNINDYYDVNLKLDRLKETGIDQPQEKRLIRSSTIGNYRFIKADLTDRDVLENLFKNEQFDVVINLAAQAGVRYSLENPYSYIDSNINGFINILENCRHHGTSHLLYASSSSVYGSNTEMPFTTADRVDNPVSLYAATKKSNELMAHTYSHLYNLKTTGLRFFTVYGPWGRPDMALFLFTKAITEGKPIDVYNYGKMARDFTYIDDIVEGIARLVKEPFDGITDKKSSSIRDMKQNAPYSLYNIGNGHPVELMDFISEIEKNLGTTSEKNMLPIQPGDVPKTWADTDSLFEKTGFQPQISVQEGVKYFVDWYKKYYSLYHNS